MSQSEAPQQCVSVCPWCNDEMALVGGVLPEHVPSYVAAVDDRPCPCAGLTLGAAQDKTDEAINAPRGDGRMTMGQLVWWRILLVVVVWVLCVFVIPLAIDGRL